MSTFDPKLTLTRTNYPSILSSGMDAKRSGDVAGLMSFLKSAGLDRRALISVALIVGVILYFNAGLSDHLGQRYRFRMTVEAATPEGVRSSSAVYEVVARKLTPLISEDASRSEAVFGQALELDLSNGPVFVLMDMPEGSKHSDLGQLSMAVLDKSYDHDWVKSAGKIAWRWHALEGDVPEGDWPVMVRFRDPNDPRTMEVVDPRAIGIRRIALETTRAHMTTGIAKALPWLSGRPSVGSAVDRDNPDRINEDGFVRTDPTRRAS
jgi:hypothetical protein